MSVVVCSVHVINHVVLGDIVVVVSVVGAVVAAGVGGCVQCARNKPCCCR